MMLLLFAPAASAASDLVYVQSDRAPLLSKPVIGSDRLIELKKGMAVTPALEQGIWYKVTVEGKTGWLCRLMTGKTAPLNGRNESSERLKSFAGSARRRPSAFTTTAAARGLVDKRKRFAGKYKLNYSDLERMESIRIADREIREFLHDGGLK